MILWMCMPFTHITNQAVALFPSFHSMPLVKIRHALEKKPEASVPSRRFSGLDYLQMLTPNVTEQNSPGFL